MCGPRWGSVRRSLRSLFGAEGRAPGLPPLPRRGGGWWPSRAAATFGPMAVADLDLDLDVFAGPFDLLLAVVLREEVSLLELQLGEVVVAYVDHLEEQGELDLEVATEFLVLIASLLELKSRLMLPREEEGIEAMKPEE